MNDPRDARYFEVLEGTPELIRQLEAFVRGEATRQSFTGYRKARAELARFEALGHKQPYWLDEPGP